MGDATTTYVLKYYYTCVCARAGIILVWWLLAARISGIFTIRLFLLGFFGEKTKRLFCGLREVSLQDLGHNAHQVTALAI